MSNTLYVGNLKWEATEESLKELFSPIGEVSSIKVIMDRETGRPRGFAFVTMENAAQAIQELNGKEFLGRPLKINEATDKPPQREGQAPRRPQGEFQPRSNQGYNQGQSNSGYSGGGPLENHPRMERPNSRQRTLDHKRDRNRREEY